MYTTLAFNQELSKNSTIIIAKHKLNIQPDITPYESAKLSHLLTLAVAQGWTMQSFDFDWFITESGLERHFE